MSDAPKFLIIDGYPKPSRDKFDHFDVRLAGLLYEDMLKAWVPDAEAEIVYTSDPGAALPGPDGLSAYRGLLWPGCNMTVYHDHDPRVTRLVQLCRDAFAVGLPQFGSCWALQIAAYVAGGTVVVNPRGREMGIGRDIYLTAEGLAHPMYRGKPRVFSGYESHDDMVTGLPEGSTCLSRNAFTGIQSAEVRHDAGVFWATQYHPEYNLYALARLTLAREEKLMAQGFFNDREQMNIHVARQMELFGEPARKDLRWQLGIDDTLLDDSVRQLEFSNWIRYQALPGRGDK